MAGGLVARMANFALLLTTEAADGDKLEASALELALALAYKPASKAALLPRHRTKKELHDARALDADLSLPASTLLAKHSPPGIAGPLPTTAV